MSTDTKLKRIAWLSSKDRERMFECVIHHIDLETLRAITDGWMQRKRRELME